MADSTNQWFIAERSRALALMHLSHRKDLVIKDVKDQDIGLTFLLSLVKEKAPPFVRQFGITLGGERGCADRRAAQQASSPDG
jgi:hypothetical protein